MFTGLVEREDDQKRILSFRKPTRYKSFYDCQPELKVNFHNVNDLTVEHRLFYFFSDALERMRNNVSLSVEVCQTREGGAGLTWNVSAPCRLDAEVWLCKKELAGGPCEEVAGSRQELHNHVQAGWRVTRNGYWVKTSRKTCTTVLNYLNLTLYLSRSTFQFIYLVYKASFKKKKTHRNLYSANSRDY